MLVAAFLGVAAIAMGNLVCRASEEAANTITQLSTPEPKTALEHNNRGVELSTKGRWTEAISEHEQAVSCDPKNKDFRNNLSSCLLRCGDSQMSRKNYDRARELYKRALEADADNLSARSALKEAEKLASGTEDKTF